MVHPVCMNLVHKTAKIKDRFESFWTDVIYGKHLRILSDVFKCTSKCHGETGREGRCHMASSIAKMYYLSHFRIFIKNV